MIPSPICANSCFYSDRLFVADMIAEVTQPSLGVGYEIGRGFALGLNILCLYRPQPDKSESNTIMTVSISRECHTSYDIFPRAK